MAILVPLLIIRKGLKSKPSRSQTFIEMVYDTAYTQIAKAGLPDEGMRIWFPYVATCFVFIWSMNVVGFIPLPFSGESVEVAGIQLPKLQIYAATANLSVALTLTLVTFVATHVEGVRYNGVSATSRAGSLRAAPPRTARSAPLLFILIAVVEVLSQFVRLVSLSFRLFFNMLAGHLVIAVFLGVGALMAASLGNAAFAVHVIGLPMGIALYLLEATLIAALQAYIFACSFRHLHRWSHPPRTLGEPWRLKAMSTTQQRRWCLVWQPASARSARASASVSSSVRRSRPSAASPSCAVS